MGRAELTMHALITAMLIIAGVREISSGRYGMGAILFAIPTAAWIGIVFGEP